VPMIARCPGKVPAGKTTDFATAFWDFLPTAAELAGTKPPPGIDGISIVPTLLGKQQKPHESLYWERRAANRLHQAVRSGTSKGYRENPGQEMELYDLKSDRAEKINIAASHPEIVARLTRLMDQSRVDVVPPKTDPRIWEKYKEDNLRQDRLLEN